MPTPQSKYERAQREGWGYDGSMASETEVLHLLTALVYAEKPMKLVETGTYSGHGTKAIQAGIAANGRGHLWTVEFNEENEYPPLEHVSFVRGDSREWTGSSDCPTQIDFAFVDCCEQPEGRVEVFSNLLFRMRPGGLLCAHDTEFYPDARYLDKMDEMVPHALHIPTLIGFTIWRV